MLILLIGLTMFLGIHSLQSLAPQVRQSVIDGWGALGFKGIYSAFSLLGFALLVQGYAQARLEPVVLWAPPTGMTHATLALMWLAMVLLVATYVPGNHIQARMRHPMTLSVKVWALAHLAHALLGEQRSAYAAVFGLQALLFALSAAVALRLRAKSTRPEPAPAAQALHFQGHEWLKGGSRT
jgi:uncharacterized membrane protein